MNHSRIFDQKQYESLNPPRAEAVRVLLGELKGELALQTAIDVGCGVGYFAEILKALGLEVTAIDGRRQNIEEAQRRYPGIHFEQCDVQDPALLALGRFDLVFCFGLLYHLENPLLALRHLKSMTRHLLLVEAVIFPGTEPLMALIDEEIHDDQGLRHIAFYPTEACLVKMMYRVGFSHVYGFTHQPQHSEYQGSRHGRRVRTMLAASFSLLDSRLLHDLPEPSSLIRPWDPRSGLKENIFDSLGRFTMKPLPKKIEALKSVVKDKIRKKV